MVTSSRVVASFAITVALFLLPLEVRHGRLWGLGVWLHLPFVVQVTLVGAAVLCGLVLWRLRLYSSAEFTERPRRNFWTFLAIAVGFGVTCVLLRATTHFLGDGYAQLQRLTQQNPYLKGWDVGEEFLHMTMYRLSEGHIAEPGLFAYRVLSVSAGVLFVAIAALAAQFLIKGDRLRVWFVLGLTSGGYCLVFFGYVENYEFLCLSILLFSVFGLLIIRNERPRWLIVPPVLIAVLLHALGALLIPAALFIVLGRGLPVNWFRRMKIELKILLLILTFTCTLVLAHYGYQHILFLKMVMVPLTRDMFTVEGYTLLSAAHLVDFLNLIVLLVPGILVFAVSGVFSKIYERIAMREYQFLIILVASTLGAAFFIEPGLGMPRDWDALSFPGVPLALLCYFAALDTPSAKRPITFSVGLAVALGFLSLVPRAITQAIPEQGIALANEYFSLDVKRNKSGMGLLSRYYLEHGDTAMFEATQRLRSVRYPEERMALHAQRLLEQRRVGEAIRAGQQVIAMNPKEPAGWLHLGRAFLLAGRPDTALSLLRIANALNPGSYHTLMGLGFAYASVGRNVDAERVWKKAIAIDSTSFQAFAELGRLKAALGDSVEAIAYLKHATQREDARGWVYKYLGDLFLAAKDSVGAIESYSAAMRRGVDSTDVAGSLRNRPGLIKILGLGRFVSKP